MSQKQAHVSTTLATGLTLETNTVTLSTLGYKILTTERIPTEKDFSTPLSALNYYVGLYIVTRMIQQCSILLQLHVLFIVI